MPADPARPVADVLPVGCVDSLVRHRILGVLRDAPATGNQVARKLNLSADGCEHHVRELARAGLIYVVTTRRVRGATEPYYAPAARRYEPTVHPAPTAVLRHALGDLQPAAQPERRLVRRQHSRLGVGDFERLSNRLEALFDDLTAHARPDQPVATLAVAFLRSATDPSADPTPADLPPGAGPVRQPRGALVRRTGTAPLSRPTDPATPESH